MGDFPDEENAYDHTVKGFSAVYAGGIIRQFGMVGRSACILHRSPGRTVNSTIEPDFWYFLWREFIHTGGNGRLPQLFSEPLANKDKNARELVRLLVPKRILLW
jgi:hypothetical protein